MSILVTGGCGYIGSHTVDQLSESGEEVIILDNLSTGSKSALLHNEKLLVADLGDSQALESIFKQFAIESVFHFAASISVAESVTNPSKYYHNNAANTINLLKECVKAGVERFLLSSTAAVYGNSPNPVVSETAPLNPLNPYGVSKQFCEKALADIGRSSGLKYSILRYFNVAGAHPNSSIGNFSTRPTQLINRCIHSAFEQNTPIEIYGTDYNTIDGTGVRDYIHVCDVASAHIDTLAYLKEGNQSDVFNIGYGTGFSVRQVIEATRKATDRELRFLESNRRRGDPDSVISDNHKIRTQTGWTPQYNHLETIISHAWEWELKLRKMNKGKTLSPYE